MQYQANVIVGKYRFSHIFPTEMQAQRYISIFKQSVNNSCISGIKTIR